METEPPKSDDSTPPESPPDEPAAAVPAGETTPVFAQTRPVAPADDPADSQAEVTEEADEALPPPLEIEKGDPDWTRPEGSSNGGAKKAPEWAQTVPTSPGDAIDEVEPSAAKVEAAVESEPGTDAPPETEEREDEWPETGASKPPVPSAAEVAEVTPAPLTEPPRAVAADALKSTWPPRAEAGPAPPEETDIWPPEPPTERAMPAWSPTSEMEEPATPAQAIPSWPDSFDSAPATAQRTPTPPAPPASTPAAAPAAQVTQPAPPPATPPASKPSIPPAPPAPAARPRVETAPPTEPKTIPPAEPPPPAPAQPGVPPRPTWAPGQPAAPAPLATAKEPSGQPMQMPAWAPRVPLAAEPGTPTWFSPKEQIPHATAQPASQPAKQPQPPAAPAPPVVGGQLPVAKFPPAPAPGAPAQPAAAKPPWQVVEQARQAKASQGPTAEDRSYAEWFAWAKRGGAPASACHAAAQGAFKALSSGKDVTTAVQWATAAMSRPPENVAYTRQTYCAWFALANIDLNLDQHRSHAFAGGAVQALEAGQDASAAHAAGLAAAGIH
ncbi:MAG: hypothetical protein E6J28_05505 [Chloroflexi bacterium]|nr:MAG: hypothetical protein E6J28_05505 [Chloroflexota bacterium]